MIFEGITSKQLFQLTDFPPFSKAVCVFMWTLTFVFIPSEALQCTLPKQPKAEDQILVYYSKQEETHNYL